MKRLRFRRQFRDALRSGRKTQTIRLWKRPPLKVGDLCSVREVGVVEILTVEPVTRERLCEGDARREGFDSVEELLETLRRIYPSVPDGKRFWRVRFRLLSPAGDDAPPV